MNPYDLYGWADPLNAHFDVGIPFHGVTLSHDSEVLEI